MYMKRTSLIRLGGLASVVGGFAYAAQGLAVWLSEPPFSWNFEYLYSIWSRQYLDNISLVFLALGALAAVAALHTLHREFRGTGTLVSLVAFVGLVFLLVGGLGDVLRMLQHDKDALWYFTPLLWGWRLAGLGVAGLGVVTIAARVLPWWCGVALIVGGPGLAPAALFGELFIALVGVAWALVGFAIFRAGAPWAEQHSRVR